MKNQDAVMEQRRKFGESFLEAIRNEDEQAIASAIAEFSEALQESLIMEAFDANVDATALACRGQRVLTSEETRYYQALAEAMSAKDVKSAITNLDVAMPQTIIDNVMEDIGMEFPVLDAIDFQNTTAITKWIINKQGVQMAGWGKLGTSITKELSGAIDEYDVTLMKLTAYMVVSKDFLALGPAWLDRYVRAILVEAIGLAAETAVIDGDGDDKPIGMTRDLTKGTTNNGKTTYTAKTAIKVTSLDPVAYGKILAELSETTTGRSRALREVILICNPKDYLQLVMPATTYMTPSGAYARDVLPYPTRIIQSAACPFSKAVVGLGKNYFLGLGSNKRGFIQYSDETQFLEDNRVYTAHLYGNGRPKDNKSFLLMDISKLEPLKLRVTTESAAGTDGE